MTSRFQPDHDVPPAAIPTLIDPEGFDVSEQQFAASLEETAAESATRFVPDAGENADAAAEAEPAGEAAPEAALEPARTEDACPTPDPDAWRREVAAKVNHYRGKRPRPPRYPSLQLRFEAPEPVSVPAPSRSFPVSDGQLAITIEPEPETAPPTTDAVSDLSAKILEFPRSWSAPPPPVDELAEPVFDRPRILEVPEVQPPPPALGGILIEPSQLPEDQRRPGLEVPATPARLTRRILAGAADALLVALAFSGFAYMFFRITSVVPPLKQSIPAGAGLLALFWVAYEYLLLVHSGSTPGLKVARLQLSRFDGQPVARGLRRWRVLASVLSGLSLGLGYAWCFLDEDELCWHDRITHTHMAPKAEKPVSATDR